MDLLIVWPTSGGEQRFVVECKIRRSDLAATITEGIAQTRGHMDRCEAETGHLVVFDQSARTWEEKVFRRDASPVTVWGM